MNSSHSAIHLRIQDIARSAPLSPAITEIHHEETERTTTFGELDRSATAIANWLDSRGCLGQNVVLTVNSPSLFVAALIGCVRAGAVAVPLYAASSRRRAALQAAVIEDCKPIVLLHDSEEQQSAIPQGDICTIINNASAVEKPQSTPNDLFYLQYTSGSTGKPKGAMISHENISANIDAISETFRFTDRSVAVNWMPHYHDFGLVFGLLAPLSAGTRVISLAPNAVGRKPLLWLKAISDYQATHSGGPDFVYQACISGISRDTTSLDLSSWKYAVVGAEPVRPGTVERFVERFGAAGFRKSAFHPCFGLAESTLMVSGDRKGLSELRTRRFDGFGANEIIGCGRAAKGTTIKLQANDGPLTDDGIGEILVGGPSVSRGYWQSPSATKNSFFDEDGIRFVRTGDIGSVVDGELFVVGRIKDVIIKAGEKHFSEDIEMTLATADPLLAEARSAAIGVEVGGQEVLVVVIEAPAEATQNRGELEAKIRQHILDTHELAIHQCVWLRRHQLPKTTSGKVQRSAVKQAWQNNEYPSPTRERFSISRPAPARDPWSDLLLAVLMDMVREVEPKISELSSQDTFASIGIDSISATVIAANLNEMFGISTSEVSLLGDITLTEASERLASSLRQQLSPEDRSRVSVMFDRLQQSTAPSFAGAATISSKSAETGSR